jgi:two-component system cell cycle sensor histidine kinase/response regulator CckA
MTDPELEALFDALPEPLLICDEDGLIVRANASAERFFGHELEELLEHPADTWLRDEQGFLWPKSDEDGAERVLLYEAGGRAERLFGVVRRIPVEGKSGWAIRLRLVAGDARVQGLQLVSGSIAVQLAEQLRTIITATTKELMTQPHATGARAMRRVLEAAEEAARLQRQLEVLSGERDLQQMPVSLGTLVLDNQRAIRAALGRYALEIDCRHGEGRVLGDPRALAALLVELAEWVCRHHGRGHGRLLMSVQERGGPVRLVLSDDGEGLSASQRAELHSPDGPGLGLALAFGMVSQHGGRVLVDSVLGQGTTFHLEFPGSVEAPTQDPVSNRGDETILVVEDEEVILRWVQVTLEALGYTVLTASNGVEASAILRSRRDIDLRIIDGILPGISGLELIAEVHATDPGARVLLMTGFSADLVGHEVLEKVPMLEKPFTPSELVDRVRAMLDT